MEKPGLDAADQALLNRIRETILETAGKQYEAGPGSLRIFPAGVPYGNYGN